MLQTFEATCLPNGTIAFAEAIEMTAPTKVLVTLMDKTASLPTSSGRSLLHAHTAQPLHPLADEEIEAHVRAVLHSRMEA